MHIDFYTRRRTWSVASHGLETQLESKKPWSFKASTGFKYWLHSIYCRTHHRLAVAFIAFE